MLSLALILLASPTHPFETPYLDPNSFILRPANILGRQEKDTDSDGLPDSWETKGHGPLVPSRHGCNPRRADMIVVTCNEAALSRADAQRQIDRMRAFYATVPGRNPDGSTGINIIHIWGNEFTAADAATPYPALYARGVPAEWRDLAHGLYITASSGGGQNDAPTWAIVINHWAAMAHELGHQLGLNHTPRGSSVFSPTYGSMMNYDYSYSFNGDPNAVQFSRGPFVPLSLRETSLNEEIPLPMADVSFLGQEPYQFRMESRGARRTAIDWNRNGTIGERSVVADINDGSSVHIGRATNGAKVAGSPSLAALDGKLVVVYPEIRSGDSLRSVLRGLSSSTVGKISYTVHSGGAYSPSQTLVSNGVTGEVSAVSGFGRLFVAFPTAIGWHLETHSLTGTTLRRASLTVDSSERGVVPTLVQTVRPDKLLVFVWNPATRGIRYAEVSFDSATNRTTIGAMRTLGMNSTGAIPPILSDSLPTVVYNTRTAKLSMVTTGTEVSSPNRIKLTYVTRLGSDEWTGLSSKWVGGAGGFERTRERVAIVCDELSGLHKIYYKSINTAPADDEGNMNLSRETADRALSEGWRTRNMIDVWNYSRSAPGAISYGGDIAFVFRWWSPDYALNTNNELHMYTQGSGIDSDVYSDFDDVSHIFTRGMKDFLLARR